MIAPEKPLGGKAYGSIGHLPHSRLGAGDHSVPDGQSKICCGKTRDKHDRVIVQEKLDGSCCAVALVAGERQSRNLELGTLNGREHRSNRKDLEELIETYSLCVGLSKGKDPKRSAHWLAKARKKEIELQAAAGLLTSHKRK